MSRPLVAARVGTTEKINLEYPEILVNASAQIDDLYKTNEKWATVIDVLIQDGHETNKFITAIINLNAVIIAAEAKTRSTRNPKMTVCEVATDPEHALFPHLALRYFLEGSLENTTRVQVDHALESMAIRGLDTSCDGLLYLCHNNDYIYPQALKMR